MNEIANILQDISNKIGYIPDWINIIGIFIPILLSVLVLIMQILHQKSNKELQKRIYNHEVDLKCFDSILEIYKVFSKSVDSLPQKKENVKNTLCDEKEKEEWLDYLINVDRELYRKYDFAVLLLGNDDTLTKTLYKKIQSYDEIINEIKQFSDKDKITIESVHEKIKQYMDSMNYENFDKHFSRYINIHGFIEQ